MTRLPVIDVYCEGPHDDPHDRFIVARFQPTHLNPKDPPGMWAELPRWSGRRLRKVHHRFDDAGRGVAWPHFAGSRFLFRCDG